MVSDNQIKPKIDWISTMSILIADLTVPSHQVEHDMLHVICTLGT